MNRYLYVKQWLQGVKCFGGRKICKKQLKGSVMVETILVLVVLIALVVIFKTQLMNLVTTIFEKITNEATGI